MSQLVSAPSLSVEGRRGFALEVDEQGIATKLWFWAAGSVTWEVRYFSAELKVRKDRCKWLKRSTPSLCNVLSTFRLRDDDVLRSRRSLESCLHTRFASSLGNRELQFTTRLMLAMYARCATDVSHYDALPCAICRSRLQYWVSVVSEQPTLLRIPVHVGGAWQSVQVRFHCGKLVDIMRCAEYIDNIRKISSTDMSVVLMCMARCSNPLLVDQAPSVLQQFAELVDVHLRRRYEARDVTKVVLLPCIIGPSGKKVRRVDPSTLLYLSERKSGAARCIKHDTSKALRMSTYVGSHVDIMATNLYTNNMRVAFEHMNRIHMAIDGACYDKREHILAAAYANRSCVAGLCHPMVVHVARAGKHALNDTRIMLSTCLCNF